MGKIPESGWEVMQLLKRFGAEFTPQPAYLEVRYNQDFADRHIELLTQYPDFEHLSMIWLPQTGVTDACCPLIAGSFPDVTVISLDDTAVTDQGVAHFGTLQRMRVLRLNNTDVGDKSAEVFAGMHKLRELGLGSTRLTDQGVLKLANLKNLNTIFLNQCQISDASIEILAGLPSLTYVGLLETQVTEAGIEQLKQARPDVHFGITTHEI